MQKIRLAFKGWNRRREEREREFVTKNAGWGAAPAAQPAQAAPRPAPRAGFDVDMEGLAVAYLDESGQAVYYLDTTNGEVVETHGVPLAEPHFRRVPARSEASESDDRRAFIDSLDDAQKRAKLIPHARSREDFRRAVSADRSLERAWYNLKNDRAIAAIEAWLRQIGLR
jgi:hypothetical protein